MHEEYIGLNKRSVDFGAPVLSVDGQWATVGGVALKSALLAGSLPLSLELLGQMSSERARAALVENGFAASDPQLDIHLVLSTNGPLETAAAQQCDGFGLQTRSLGHQKTFAAKLPEFTSYESRGMPDASSVLKATMSAVDVAVELTGQAAPSARGSLAMIAGQALEKGIQGFAFDGIPGKYQVELSMAQMVDLHKDAAGLLAEQSARVALGLWTGGAKAATLHEWVPDSVQRLLQGTLSLPAAAAIVHAIDGGAIGRHAGEIGGHRFGNLLMSQGIDVEAKNIQEQADELDVALVAPERKRGQYVGKVVGIDHRAALIKFNRDSAIELPFSAVPAGAKKPAMGDTVRVGFKAGVIAVSVADRGGQSLSDR
jgi:hypothetical protein